MSRSLYHETMSQDEDSEQLLESGGVSSSSIASDSSDGEALELQEGSRSPGYTNQQRELDQLMDQIGTTRLHWNCVLILGLANAADAVEVLAIGYIITVFKDPVSGKHIDDMAGWSSLLTSAVFVGMLFGGLASGSLGDRLGRKPLLSISLIVNAIAALVSAFTPALPDSVQVAWLVFFRFVGGLGVGGSVPSAFALGSELGPTATRSLFINIIACFWSAGVLYTSLCAYLLLHSGHDGRWPLFAALVSVPAGIAGLFCVYRLEESPRFLLARGKVDAVKSSLIRFIQSDTDKQPVEVLNKLRQMVQAENCLVPSAREVDEINVDRGQTAAIWHNIQKLVFGLTLRRTTFYVCGIFMFLSFAHYGISSWISDLFKKVDFSDPYLTSLFYTFATVPGLLFALRYVDILGRKTVTAGSLVLACVSALLFSLNTSRRGYVMVSAVLFNACAASSWNALDVFSAELFPEDLRGTGLGIATACGRIGSIMANVFNSVVLADDSKADDSKNVSIVLLGAGIAMMLAALCTCMLPETLVLRHTSI